MRTTRRQLLLPSCGPLWAAWGALGASSLHAQTALRIPDPQLVEPGSLTGYYPAALRLALESTRDLGPVPDLVTVGGPGMGRERFRLLLAEGELDLLWSSSTPERERLYQPVRFNLIRGVNEYRVLLVRRTDLPRFATVQNLDGLRRFVAGAGLHWSDTAILRGNGFRVETSAQHHSLYKMLAAGRFDFMARGLAEVEDDLQAHPGLDLVPAPRLMLRYPQPIYFFATRGNRRLAERLRLGLQRAEADGSLNRLFMATPALAAAWKASRAPSRRVLMLKSPSPHSTGTP